MKGKKFYVALIGLFIMGIGSIFIYRQQQEARALEFEGYEITSIESRVDALYNADKTDIQEEIEPALAELEQVFDELNKKDLSYRSEKQIEELEENFLTAKAMHKLQEDILALFKEEEVVQENTTVEAIEALETSLTPFEDKTVYYKRNSSYISDARAQVETIEEAMNRVEQLTSDETLIEDMDEEELEKLEELIDQIKDEDLKERLLEEVASIRLVLAERTEEEVVLEDTEDAEEEELDEETEELLEEGAEEESVETVQETAQLTEPSNNTSSSQPKRSSSSSSSQPASKPTSKPANKPANYQQESQQKSPTNSESKEQPKEAEQRPAVERKYRERKVIKEIPFETLTYRNANISAGEEIVYQAGQPGQVIEIYEVTEYKNGTSSKTFITTEETLPEDRVVTIGTKEPEPAAE